MERIKAIVFDWDGTLIDSMNIKVNNAAVIFAQKYSLNPDLVAQSYRRYSGVSRRELFNLIAREHLGRDLRNIEYQAISSQFSKKNCEILENKQFFSSKNKEVLAQLHKMDLLLFISSSCLREEIERLAGFYGIDCYFSEILGSYDKFKKGIAHLSYIKQKYGLKSREIMVVGDEKADIRLAGRVGVVCVGLISKQFSDDLAQQFPDCIISDLRQLPEVVSSCMQ